jgi:hypothetical protein
MNVRIATTNGRFGKLRRTSNSRGYSARKGDRPECQHKERITGEISIDKEVLKKEYADSKKESGKTLEEFINKKIEEKKNEVFGKFLTNKKQEYEIKVNRPLFEGISKKILGEI